MDNMKMEISKDYVWASPSLIVFLNVCGHGVDLKRNVFYDCWILCFRIIPTNMLKTNKNTVFPIPGVGRNAFLSTKTTCLCHL